MPLHMKETLSHSRFLFGLCFIGTFAALALLHGPLLRLPYYWDEAGYYIPAALDFFRHGLLIPQSTLPTGHTPLVPVCLALAWRLLGCSPLVTRLILIAFAAATLVALYALGRLVARRETALWACLLLALLPLFFAQSSLAFLDLPAAFTTTLAVWALLRRRMAWFVVAASLAVLTKETAVIIVPVALVFGWRFRQDLRRSDGLWLAAPIVTLGAWAAYYHHVTGFWTGNAQYLQYNLYSTLEPGRIAVSLLRRLYQVLIAGFNWLLVVAAGLGYFRIKKLPATAMGHGAGANEPSPAPARKEFFFLSISLAIAYVAMLSLVGGAVLPRYLLPMFPCFYLALTMLAEGLPRRVMRPAFVLIAACFVASWFINPPYPFAYENNLAYADFIHLHQQAAEWLSSQPGDPRILTAWPATDELTHPELGYVDKPLRVAGVPGFTAPDFRNVSDNSFDLLYLYSRKWDPPGNWLRRLPLIAHADEYSQPIAPPFVAFRFQLRLVATFSRRGQWVRIYARRESPPPGASVNF
jgi:4-amino-4-deoxy-L-arabinose transferase-like glycosyltransferase